MVESDERMGRLARTFAAGVLALRLAPALGCSAIEDFVDGFGDDPPPAIPAKADDAPASGPAASETPEPTVAETADGAGGPRAGGVARMMAKVEAAKPKLPAYGVVRDGARMFIAPSRVGGHFVAGGDDQPPPVGRYYYGAPPATETKPSGRAVRIVGLSGDMLEVETMTTEDDELACAPLQPELSRVRTRLWVEESALVPVLTHSVTVDLDEHAKVTLSPGVPVFATDDEGTFRIFADGVELTLPLPENPPDRWYAAALPNDAEAPVGTMGTWYNMTLAGKMFPPDGAAGRQQGQLYGDANGNTWLFADDTVDGNVRVRVKNRCLDVEGVVVTDPRSPKPTTKTPAWARRGAQTRPPHVLAGTRLRWEDGSDAGIAVAPILLTGTESKSGADTCFPIASDAESPSLCVATTDLEKSPGKRAEEGLVLTASTGWNNATDLDVAVIDELWEHSDAVLDCFRDRVSKKPGYNYASANINIKVKTDGSTTVNWGSAWTSHGSSTKLQTCIEDVAKTFAIVGPVDEDTNTSLNLSVTRM